jgi:hypothetical protein
MSRVNKIEKLNDRVYYIVERYGVWIIAGLLGTSVLLSFVAIAFSFPTGDVTVGSDGREYSVVTFSIPTESGVLECVGVKGHGFESLTCP